MKVSVFEIEDWERAAFERLAGEHDVRFERGRLDARLAERHADAEVLSPFIYSKLVPDVLDRVASLRLVATRSTGVDHVDLDWCREHEVTVTNVPAYGERTVAEHVFALLLALSHHIVEAVDRTRRGDFSQVGLRGFDLAGRTLGVVGTGAIGRHVIRIAKGFEMRVVATDVDPDLELAASLGFDYLDLPELLATADVVTLHVPGGPSTRHLIGAEQLGQIKRGAVLVNTSRGQVVDAGALVRALTDGTLAAAGLDVLEAEPALREESELLRSMFAHEHDLETLLSGHVLLRLRNVVITPHSAFNTSEAVGEILETTCENIASFAAGEPRNVV